MPRVSHFAARLRVIPSIAAHVAENPASAGTANFAGEAETRTMGLVFSEECPSVMRLDLNHALSADIFRRHARSPKGHSS
jgi:hypothetical protein